MAPRRLNASLWIGQIVLAVIFMTASYVKTTTPLDELATALPYTANMPGIAVRIIGICEGLGALGLILPSLTRIMPILTPIAAAGLTLLMFFASIVHLLRGELQQLGGVIVLGAVAAGVAWGRYKDAPILPAAERDQAEPPLDPLAAPKDDEGDFDLDELK
jgi:membrane protease YdiL (CAAX protease family)